MGVVHHDLREHGVLLRSPYGFFCEFSEAECLKFEESDALVIGDLTEKLIIVDCLS